MQTELEVHPLIPLHRKNATTGKVAQSRARKRYLLPAIAFTIAREGVGATSCQRLATRSRE